MKTSVSIALILSLVMVIAVTAGNAAPSTITLKNMSSAGQTNYPATCSIVGINDKIDKVNDTFGRINLTSLRTYALTKGGMANYSTVLHARGTSFKVYCAKTATGESYSNATMYFDRVTTPVMYIVNGEYKFY